MMFELLQKIYNITLELERILEQEDYEEFDRLLQIRNVTMTEVDGLKVNHPNFQYTNLETQLLEDIYALNSQLMKKSEDIKTNSELSINKMNSKKQLFKYKPYFKQTSGVFVDETLGKG
ncbi:hypothetical protein [Pseudoneobacillus rhizosphaerae]|uniref:Flagellar protein FliT n=1 Tax=Pseudoneobacillus rhizosphaerae TaxID=2880968 RepID=A0A9C7LBU0_9BACI|nr:hypothetical protein [Pseudoneobacillus rhizosphaerae]CAG9609782.1 hypothetical protein NEOCIP111885_03525 [Pseudoneobacillus rhizosphaerae]